MYRHFSLFLPELFQYLYPKSFIIKNKVELEKFVLKFFKDYIKDFEGLHPKYIARVSVYGEENSSYSFESFHDIMITIIKWNLYEGDGLHADMKDIYLEIIKKSGLDRDVTPELYRSIILDEISRKEK